MSQLNSTQWFIKRNSSGHWTHPFRVVTSSTSLKRKRWMGLSFLWPKMFSFTDSCAKSPCFNSQREEDTSGKAWWREMGEGKQWILHIWAHFNIFRLFEIAERCAGEHNRFHKYFKADRWAIFSSYFILSHQKPLIFQYLIFKLSEHLQEKDVKCITLTLHSNSTLFAMFTISSICFILPTSWLHASTIYRPKAYTGKLDVSSENLSNLSEVNLVKIVQKKAHYHFIQTLCTWIENVKVWKPGVTLETSFRALSAEAWPCDSGSVFFRMAWNAKKHRVVLDKSSETALQESRQLWLYNWPPGGPVTYWAKFVNCVTGPMQESLG